VRIRPAESADAERLADLLAQMGYPATATEAAERFARERGCYRLEVTTRPDRAAARGLYESLGFEERPRRLVKPLE